MNRESNRPSETNYIDKQARFSRGLLAGLAAKVLREEVRGEIRELVVSVIILSQQIELRVDRRQIQFIEPV